VSDARQNHLQFPAPPAADRIQRRSLIIGVVALVVAIAYALATRNSAQFFRSYLLAFVWWTGVSLGCMAILMMQHLTGGLWGFVIRRPLEAASRILPLMAVLFVPLVFALPKLYQWANHDLVAHDKLMQHQATYLATKWFIVRAVIYFAAWIVLAYFLNRWSESQDRTRSTAVRRHLRDLSGPGLVIYVLTVTFASIDWMMSLDPHWGSTIYGFILIAGQALAAVSFATAILFLLMRHQPMSNIVQEKHLHSLGKLMLTFVMLWAYMSFSQLLIIWAGNLPDEISWYLRRMNTGWKWVGLALILFHFVLPFVLLLSRDLKRHARKLAWLAIFLIAVRYLDLLFWIAPSPVPGSLQGIGFQWLDVVLPIGIGGLWLAAFFRYLKQRPLVPLYDQRFEEVVGHAPR